MIPKGQTSSAVSLLVLSSATITPVLLIGTVDDHHEIEFNFEKFNFVIRHFVHLVYTLCVLC